MSTLALALAHVGLFSTVKEPPSVDGIELPEGSAVVRATRTSAVYEWQVSCPSRDAAATIGALWGRAYRGTPYFHSDPVFKLGGGGGVLVTLRRWRST